MPHIIPHIVRKFDLKITDFIRPVSKGILALRNFGVVIIEGSWTNEDLIMRNVKDIVII